MKLTTEQVEMINSFLVKNEVVFDDVRHEIIDHIACDVEQNYEGIPFNESIAIVLKKWERQIQLSESIWVTTWASFPTIVLSKLKQRVIPQLLFFTIGIIISLGLSRYFPELKNLYSDYSVILKWIYGIWFAAISILGIRLFFSRGFTTYKYLFKRNFYIIYLTKIIITITNTSYLFLLFFLLLNIFNSYFLLREYRAHFKFLKFN